MREILFRGKRIDNGEWVEGFYFETPLTDEATGSKPEDGWFFLTGRKRHCISRNNCVYEVDPSSVCQFTGLTDKNGKKIFEGDTLGKHGFWSLVVEFQRIMPLHPVQYNNSKGIPIYSFDSTSWEIIGNIYDNFCPNCGADNRGGEVKQ